MKHKKIIGYTTGVYDLFHIGHLNILKQAKSECDYLIVGVTTDEEVERLKGIKPFIPFEERIEIIKQIKYVDEVHAEHNNDKILAWKELRYDKLFKGSDWKNTADFKRYDDYFKNKNVIIEFFPYTKGTSSTQIRNFMQKQIEQTRKE